MSTGYDLSASQIEQLWQQLERDASAIEILEQDGNMLERLQFFRGNQRVEILRVWRAGCLPALATSHNVALGSGL